MRQMQTTKWVTGAEGIAHHAGLGARVYAECGIQKTRIEKSRKYLQAAIEGLGPGLKVIVELGCGCMDISGPFVEMKHEVIGLDCNMDALRKARELHPGVVAAERVIEDAEVISGDILVLCEVLEHLIDPAALVQKWLPHFKAAVISHPIEETLDSGLSAGDHRWSLSETDLVGWFPMGFHAVKDVTKFQMGSYQIGLARGVKA